MTWTFSYVIGGPRPMAQLMTAHCLDSATETVEQPPIQVGMGTDATWLHVSPTSGMTPLQMQVTVDPGTLPAGTYFGHVKVMTTSEPIANAPVSAPVTLTITGVPIPPPSTRPTVRFVTHDGATFKSNNKEFVVAVSDNVVAVKLFVDSNAMAVCSQAARAGSRLPTNVELQWMESTIPRGTYQLTAFSMDASGQASLPAQITVKRI